MPYIITTLAYPSEKVGAIVERYFEALEKFPHDENLATLIVQSAVKSCGKEGIKSISIEEPKDGMLQDAMALNIRRMAMFHSIPGFTYQMDVFLNIVEALAVVGQSLPEHLS